jgi:Domain of unknown function (DUF222)
MDPGDARDGQPHAFAQPAARDSEPHTFAQPSARDGEPHAFAQGGVLDTAQPCAALACVLDEISGPARLAAGTTDGELVGLLSGWDGIEAWAAAAKLGIIRALIRRRPHPGTGTRPGGLPSGWQQDMTSEVALELAISLRAADTLIDLAWTLEARLPNTAAALGTGVLSLAKARIIADATSVLDGEHAAAAENLIAGRWAGKTPSQIAALIARAVITVDPDGARKRREEAERENARVEFWREHAGTAALAAFGLPADRALEANQCVQNRALACKAAGIKLSMDQLRVLAYLDLLTEQDSRDNLAAFTTTTDDDEDTGGHDGTGDESTDGIDDQGDAGDEGHGDGKGSDGRQGGQDGHGNDGRQGGQDGHGNDGRGGGHGPAGTGSSGTGGGSVAADGTGTGPGLAAKVNLTIPLQTYLGLAERPGEAHGLGPIDPELARHLAAAAARNDRSAWCVTITDNHGHAIAHGCARPTRTTRTTKTKPDRPGSGTGNRDGPAFTRRDDHGPPGGYGTWTLRLPGGRELRVRFAPIPVTDCDHRLESRGYQPSGTLRHMVEIRDGACDFPPCVRAAGRCDFEHAVPYDKGGRTCACNAGPRCRRDHKLKQTQGWTVTQPLPGYHEWTTPAGRSYPTEPMRYPS